MPRKFSNNRQRLEQVDNELSLDPFVDPATVGEVREEISGQAFSNEKLNTLRVESRSRSLDAILGDGATTELEITTGIEDQLSQAGLGYLVTAGAYLNRLSAVTPAQRLLARKFNIALTGGHAAGLNPEGSSSMSNKVKRPGDDT